jgi:hypothetical protein
MHCSNCGHLLATGDKFCTGCGRPIAVIPVEAKKKKTHPVVALLAVVLAVIVISAIIDGVRRSVVTDPSSSAEDAANGERTERAARGALTLKNAMRNPDSFKLSSALVMPTGSVCYAYRAQNGFGGFDVGHAVLTTTGKFKTDDSDGFTTLWNKECANKTGQETTDSVNTILEHPFLYGK